MGTKRAEQGVDGGNRLKHEKSPYLVQHAENPVDWYPWSAEAFEKARREDKPVLVSIGYSTCHWCHVMERESYEDAETAHVMNENFVNIKVDREERPDVDSLYMKAVQALGGHGGWPLNVFTTPDGAPFFGGTYWPPEDRYGMPSFRKILRAVSDTYKKDKTGVGSVTAELEEVLARTLRAEKVDAGPGLADRAAEAAGMYFDPVNGGFGISTKFPHAMFLSFLLKYHGRTGSERALEIVRTSLAGMAMGGIYDHIGGGFHRYSVDERWEVPHFEKMLYDNALLLELYSKAWKATGEELFRDAAAETVRYLFRETRSPEEGFYAARDADSEGREGKYYVWTTTEVIEALGPEDGERFIDYFSLTDEGNYEGANTLRVDRGASEEVVPIDGEMKELTEKLFEVRSKRVPPDTDRKVITAWNGLAVKALVEASSALGDDSFLEAARRCARFILDRSRDGEGRLHRYCLDGPSVARGNLEDYSVLGEALVSLHSRDGGGGWLDEALELAGRMTGLFAVEGEPLLFDTPEGGTEGEGLFVRERDLHDTDLPSGNSAAAGFLLGLGRAAGREDLTERARGILGSVEGMAREPLSYGHLLCVLEDYLAGKKG